MAGLVDTDRLNSGAFVELDRLLDRFIQEATQSVEQELSLEDSGWTRLGSATADVITPQDRILNVRTSRLYFAKDPLAKQAIRLWTDYTFGIGMSFLAKDEKAQEVLSRFWNDPNNRAVLSARGQRKSSDKALVDGDIFYVIFLGPNGTATIRWIDPLEITEIITDPDDIENVLYYKRSWTDRQGDPHTSIYRSAGNLKNEATIDSQRKGVSATDDGVVFHLALNTITQRGNPLLLPGLDWLFQYRRFLAARVSIMLALTRFAWSMKVKGGQLAVDAQAGKLAINNNPPEAGAVSATNEGVDLTPIKTDTGAKNAHDDGRMLKLQVFAAVGLPETYFADVSVGNLATAKTVELPVIKMFQSQQQVWEDFYQSIDEVVMAHNDIAPDKWYVDRNWPPIAPRDVAAAAKAIVDLVGAFPEFAEVDAVKQAALLTMGIDDPAEVLETLENVIKGNPDAKFARSLREFREYIKVSGNGKGE